jgi:tRNA pseudouridine55 synthase
VGVIDLELLVECSSGTYIRALARDIGEQLGVGGHLIALRRLAVGPFELEGAPAASEIAPEHIVGMADAAGLIMPIVEVSGPAKDDIVHGRKIECTGWPEGQPLAVVDEGAGNLLAVIECVAGRSRILMGVPQS